MDTQTLAEGTTASCSSQNLRECIFYGGNPSSSPDYVIQGHKMSYPMVIFQ